MAIRRFPRAQLVQFPRKGLLDLVLADAEPVDLPGDANADTLVSPQIELGALDGRVELDRTGDT